MEDHGDFAPANFAHLIVALRYDVLPVQDNLSRDDAGSRPGNEAQQGQGGHGLTATRLANYAQGFPLAQRETDAVHGLGGAPADEKVGVQVPNFQDRVPEITSD